MDNAIWTNIGTLLTSSQDGTINILGFGILLLFVGISFALARGITKDIKEAVTLFGLFGVIISYIINLDTLFYICALITILGGILSVKGIKTNTE